MNRSTEDRYVRTHREMTPEPKVQGGWYHACDGGLPRDGAQGNNWGKCQPPYRAKKLLVKE